jgi:hypothetical protein
MPVRESWSVRSRVRVGDILFCSERFFSLTVIVLFPLNMATDKPLLLSAILGSKNAMTIMKVFCTDLYLDIEVEGDVRNGKRMARSQYYVQLYVADKEVAISSKLKLEPLSSVLKWEWNADNQMWVLPCD